MIPPSVAAEPPPGWLTADVARPALGGGSDAVVTQWTALRPHAGGEGLLLGCVATPIPGWVEDMRPAVEARTASLAASSADRLAGGDAAAHTRTFVGWTPREVVTCFATCAAPKGQRRACDASVDAARLDVGSSPPPPGVGLGAVTWAVHHPSETVVWGGVFTFFVAAVAVLSRRRPRSRI
ncbi:hypothetical protein BH11MYX4_BH11MYX4_56030 [soil metagenome]